MLVRITVVAAIVFASALGAPGAAMAADAELEIEQQPPATISPDRIADLSHLDLPLRMDGTPAIPDEFGYYELLDAQLSLQREAALLEQQQGAPEPDHGLPLWIGLFAAAGALVVGDTVVRRRRA